MRSSPAIIEPIVVESKVDHESIVERFERISQLFQIEIVDGVHRRATSESDHSLPSHLAPVLISSKPVTAAGKSLNAVG
jgi:hypothetical protein